MPRARRHQPGLRPMSRSHRQAVRGWPLAAPLHRRRARSCHAPPAERGARSLRGAVPRSARHGARSAPRGRNLQDRRGSPRRRPVNPRPAAAWRQRWASVWRRARSASTPSAAVQGTRGPRPRNPRAAPGRCGPPQLVPEGQAPQRRRASAHCSFPSEPRSKPGALFARAPPAKRPRQIPRSTGACRASNEALDAAPATPPTTRRALGRCRQRGKRAVGASGCAGTAQARTCGRPTTARGVRRGAPSPPPPPSSSRSCRNPRTPPPRPTCAEAPETPSRPAPAPVSTSSPRLPPCAGAHSCAAAPLACYASQRSSRAPPARWCGRVPRGSRRHGSPARPTAAGP
mmetsp:Transcript_8170/g.20509  ORF Transcript_8170/g.20509 Transcript_8170/m.20509 type:complete len:344 (-) Transcript_8170:2402-3433(-)